MQTCKIISVPILPSNAFQNYSLTNSSHTRTNLISAPAHAPTSTPHTVRRQALAAQPSQGQPRSCRPYHRSLLPNHVAPPRSHPSTGEIAPIQPHRHAPLLHVFNPPLPSPPLPSSKLPSSMSFNPHPSY